MLVKADNLFLARLCPLVPPPGFHMARYFGVLENASNPAPGSPASSQISPRSAIARARGLGVARARGSGVAGGHARCVAGGCAPRGVASRRALCSTRVRGSASAASTNYLGARTLVHSVRVIGPSFTRSSNSVRRGCARSRIRRPRAKTKQDMSWVSQSRGPPVRARRSGRWTTVREAGADTMPRLLRSRRSGPRRGSGRRVGRRVGAVGAPTLRRADPRRRGPRSGDPAIARPKHQVLSIKKNVCKLSCWGRPRAYLG